ASRCRVVTRGHRGSCCGRVRRPNVVRLRRAPGGTTSGQRAQKQGGAQTSRSISVFGQEEPALRRKKSLVLQSLPQRRRARKNLPLAPPGQARRVACGSPGSRNRLGCERGRVDGLATLRVSWISCRAGPGRSLL